MEPLIFDKYGGSCMERNCYHQNTKQGRKFLHFPQVCHKHAKNSKLNYYYTKDVIVG